MREERKIRFYRPLPGEHVLLMVIFALFIVLVLTLLLIPLFSFTWQQSQTTSARPETAPGLVTSAATARPVRNAEKLFLLVGDTHRL